MPERVQRITPFLWYDGQAEAAAKLYTSVFPNSRIVSSSPMTTSFELDGLPLIALNGGPQFEFTEAFSLLVNCASQDEIDFYWARLVEGGSESQCGWLKDRFGLSWQIVPAELPQLLGHPDPAKARRALEAMLQMKKLDLAALRRAVA